MKHIGYLGYAKITSATVFYVHFCHCFKQPTWWKQSVRAPNPLTSSNLKRSDLIEAAQILAVPSFLHTSFTTTFLLFWRVGYQTTTRQKDTQILPIPPHPFYSLADYTKSSQYYKYYMNSCSLNKEITHRMINGCFLTLGR